MHEGEAAPAGVTLHALLAACGSDLPDLRDAALLSLAYDAGLRVSELVAIAVTDVTQGEGAGLALARDDDAAVGVAASERDRGRTGVPPDQRADPA